MKYEIKEVEIADLVPAPWNPRDTITEDSVKDLVEDIRENGLLHNIGVWLNPASNESIIAYGNRRAFASRIAGNKTILAMVFTDCTELEARDLTRRENELRLGIDPIKDSELLGSMRSMGMTEKDLADKYRVPIAMVCRRLKLVDLAPGVREWIAKGAKFSTDALERISAYPAEIQESVVSDVLGRYNDFTRQFAWSSFEYGFNDKTLDLDNGVKFDDCAACPMRTGATPDLFGDVEEKGFGRCLNPECYKRHQADLIRQRLAAAIDPSVTERVKLKYDWDFTSNGAVKEKPDEKHPCAYYVADSAGNVTVKYGPSKAAKKEKAKAAKDLESKKAKEREERDKLINSTAKKMATWFKKNFRKCAESYVGKDCLKVFDLVIAFSINVEFYNNDRSKSLAKWKKSRSFNSWYDVFGSRFLSSCSEWKFRNGSFSHDIVTLFKDVKWSDVFTKQELDLIRSDFK